MSKPSFAKLADHDPGQLRCAPLPAGARSDAVGPCEPWGPWTRLARPAGLIVALAALALPAQAVMLGAAQVQSALGQPLVAEIRVLDADANSLSATPASPAVREHFGELPTLPTLGRVDVQLVHKPDGAQVLRVTSERPVHEPIVELLLRVEDSRGHIVRRLPLLLDPPSTAAPVRVADASTPSTQRSETRARAAKLAASKTQAGASSRTAAKRGGKRKRGPVKQARKSRSTSAPLAAVSRKGAPAVAAARRASVSTGAARATAAPPRRQAVAGAGEHGIDRPAAAPAPQLAAASQVASAALPAADSARETVRTGVPTQDSRIAMGSPDPAVAASHTTTDAVPAVDAAPAGGPSAAEPSAPEDSGPGMMSANAATRPSVPGSGPADAPASLANEAGSRSALLGATAALLAGLLALGWRRRRRHQRATASRAADATAGVDSLVFGPDTTGPETPGQVATQSGRSRPASQGVDDFHASALQTHEEVDPLAEADVYLAYGRADQARAILEDALHRHPDRSALHLKLAAIHLEQRDAMAFKHRARVLATLTGQHGAHWLETCRMGQSLDPDEPLYAADSEAGGLPARPVEPQAAAAAGAPGTDTGPDSSWVEFGFSEGPSEPEAITESSALPEHPAEAPDGAAQTGGSALDLELFGTSAAPREPQQPAAPLGLGEPGPLEDFADTSRFAALPARIAHVQQLLDSGALEQARAEALDLARLGTELEAQASALADLASASGQPLVLER